MNKEEKFVSFLDLDFDGELFLFEGKPFSGVCVEYYKNGKKKEETHYKNGEMNGLKTKWYESGNKEEEIRYKDGLIIGLWVEYYENGRKKFEREYGEGAGHIVLCSQWHADGTKAIEECFENGVQISRTIFFGELTKEIHFENGNIVSEIEIIFYESGEKKSEALYEIGKEGKVREITFYKSGIKKSKKHFKCEIENGLRTEWDEDGKKTYEGMFIDGNEQ
jgi:antitoxin component YwqK of YwqJK toxin-antitoxin module